MKPLSRSVSPMPMSVYYFEAMLGNQYLFVRRDEVEQAWKWVDGILDAWKVTNEPPKPYQAGTWGPVSAISLLAREDRNWDE